MTFTLSAALVVGLVGCSGLIDDLIDDIDDDIDDNGGIALRILPGQALTAQQQADGSFQVHAQPLRAAGGAPFSGYTWACASGSNFPPGTTVAPLTGVFSGGGNGLVAGNTYQFEMQVSDGTSTARTNFTLTVAGIPVGGIPPFMVFQQWMGVPTIQLPDAKADQPYGASLAVLAGTPPYSWFEDASYAGRGDFNLSGLVIDQASGIVRGTLMHSAAGKTLRFRIVVKDHTGETAVTEPGRPVYEIVVQ
jgi:hypothetical protein